MELKIENLTKKYGNFIALNDVSVTFSSGIYGLLGPNGAGNSTLIKLSSDNIPRTTGKILWDGTEILELGEKYRDVLGYMPQQQGFYEDFSVEAFLLYMAKIKGLKKCEARKQIQNLLEYLNLEKKKKERIGTLSGGMKQRVLLAQAMLNDPKILILDEPTAGVDPQERINIRNIISRIAEDRIVIIATHIVSDIEAIAKDIILLKNGSIIKNCSPQKLVNELEKDVAEMEVAVDEIPNLEEKYIISSMRYSPNGMHVKILGDNVKVKIESKETVPTLEDVYLYYFNDIKG